MTEQEINKITENHPTSYKGIFHSYNWKDIKESKPFVISIFLSILFYSLSYFSKCTLWEILDIWASLVVSIFPNLLGFNLGGYALIIGFGNTDLVESMTKINENKNKSIFQMLSGIFAFAIILQLSAFCFAFAVFFFNKLNLYTTCTYLANSVNTVTIFSLSFLAIWSILILFNLVANVFSFGQAHHFQLTIKRSTKQNNSK